MHLAEEALTFKRQTAVHGCSCQAGLHMTFQAMSSVFNPVCTAQNYLYFGLVLSVFYLLKAHPWLYFHATFTNLHTWAESVTHPSIAV